MMHCCRCGCDDHPVVAFFDGSTPVMAHHIHHDIYPLDRNYLTPEEKAQGFEYKLFQGEHVKFRDLCTDCLIKQEDTRQKRKAMKAEIEKYNQDRDPRKSEYVTFCQFN